jgi:hypothetical protein
VLYPAHSGTVDTAKLVPMSVEKVERWLVPIVGHLAKKHAPEA